MPIPPRPVVIHCPRCHWQMTFAPRSDCIPAHEAPPEVCPKCGCEGLERVEPGDWDRLIGNIKKIFSHL